MSKRTVESKGPAEKRAQGPECHREHGRHRRRQRADDHHAARAADDLGEDVVPGVVGAQDVLAGGLAVELAEVGDLFGRGEQRSENGEEDEESEDDEGRGADLVAAEKAQKI